MTKSNISFPVPQFTKRAVAVAVAAGALFILGIQGAPTARAEGDMGNMEGMQQSSPATEFPFGEPGKAAQVDRTIRVTLNTMSFAPAFLEVKVGETIRFVVTNKSKLDHDFTIGDVKTQTAHRAEMAKEMGEMAHDDDPNAVLVGAGQRRELLWKFTRAGRLEFDCNVPGHYEAGMRGTINVRE